jgi:hypothetical protein
VFFSAFSIKIAEIIVTINAKNPTNAARISPTSDSSKLMRLFVIEGSIKQITNTTSRGKSISKIPIAKPAIFIKYFTSQLIVRKDAKTFHAHSEKKRENISRIIADKWKMSKRDVK